MIADYAYTAGLIDGEGTVGLTTYGRPALRFRFPTVTVPNCTPELVRYLRSTFGGSVSNKRTYKKHHRPSYIWCLTRHRALKLLDNVLPYMKEPEKIRRAALLVNEYQVLTPRNGRYSSEMMQAKHDFERRFFTTSYARQQPVS